MKNKNNNSIRSGRTNINGVMNPISIKIDLKKSNAIFNNDLFITNFSVIKIVSKMVLP